MKFKLNKAEHLSKFQLVNKIGKLKITTHENKSLSNDSLVFYCDDNKLYLYVTNTVSSSLVFLCDYQDEFDNFAVDCSSFTNAFTNFPSDEVQFVYIKEDNQLIFGNKKTRVSLKTSLAEDINDVIKQDLSINENIQFQNVDFENFTDSIKYTTFSCSSDIDEYPYSSIMFFIENDLFHSQSSDKHRISIYGNQYENQSSYLISKHQAELIQSYITKDYNYKYSIYKNKFIIKWNENILVTSLENNSHQSVYSSFSKFFNDSIFIAKVVLEKEDILKSLKFNSNISGSHLFNIKSNNNELVISSSSVDKGAVADKINIDQTINKLDVSYLISHFIKCLEVINSKTVEINFYNYNDFTLCIVNDNNFTHLLFPME